MGVHRGDPGRVSGEREGLAGNRGVVLAGLGGLRHWVAMALDSVGRAWGRLSGRGDHGEQLAGGNLHAWHKKAGRGGLWT